MLRTIIACTSIFISAFIPFPSSWKRDEFTVSPPSSQTSELSPLSNIMRNENPISVRSVVLGVIVHKVTQNPNFFIVAPTKFVFENFMKFFRFTRSENSTEVQDLITME